VIKKLAGKYEKVHVCYEAGPTGYGLYRQIRGLGHECAVVAPSLIPKKPGDRIKTNRRDATTLARLFRAGELTSVWVPDAVHEAVRDLVRARETAAADVRKKRQQLLSFLLRHGRIYSGRKHWTRAHARWLAAQAFEHPALSSEESWQHAEFSWSRTDQPEPAAGRRNILGPSRPNESLPLPGGFRLFWVADAG
jgi:transposase